MSIDINGTIVNGVDGAHTALAFQLPHLVSRFPVLVGCHPGTINVQLDQPLRVDHPDFETPPIKWFPGHPSEKFAFLEISFESPLGSAPRRAWIYIPSNSPHFHNVFQVEMIAPFIHDAAATAAGVPCCIHIPKQHRTGDLIII